MRWWYKLRGKYDPSTLFEARQVAGSATYKQSKTVWNVVWNSVGCFEYDELLMSRSALCMAASAINVWSVCDVESVNVPSVVKHLLHLPTSID